MLTIGALTLLGLVALDWLMKRDILAPGVLFCGMWALTLFALALLGSWYYPVNTVALTIYVYGGFMAGLDVLSSGRIVLLEAASQAFLRRPWFGSGLGNSPPISTPFGIVELWRAHNFIMGLLMFSGMVGTMIQCCVYLLAAHSLRIKAVFSPWATGAFFSSSPY